MPFPLERGTKLWRNFKFGVSGLRRIAGEIAVELFVSRCPNINSWTFTRDPVQFPFTLINDFFDRSLDEVFVNLFSWNCLVWGPQRLGTLSQQRPKIPAGKKVLIPLT